ncbi:sigma-54 interaction domain-containing protein [uncultured Bradyrhizobium sp.]|uniref:sigma-54 interaction domain-containing protein n=1 Tax=uncultured Bradyrhizobium sp. TaxID=199684 RepID=UPI0035C9B51F
MTDIGASRQGRNESSDSAFTRLNLLGESLIFRKTLRIIERIADVDATVLIQGETGTGKELAARALHYLSPRREFPFIPVNCGALPDNLLESELFGHERGAFTDAKKASRGLVSQAEGGTLLLDEVEAMTPRAQVVLLRFLQDHTYRPVGGRQISSGDLRIIASSNVDLEEMVRRGEFRRDLLFRFGILNVTMPPLRERGRDVALLAECFLDRFATQYERPQKRLHPSSIAWLMSHDWPGNIRELENLMLREFLLADGEVIQIAAPQRNAADLAFDRIDVDETFKSAKARAIALFEKNYLRHLLTETCGNVSQAARISRKDRSTLNKLVKKHGLASDRFRSAGRRP